MRRLILAGTFVAAAMFVGANSAQAALVCNSCTYAGAPGTYLGVLAPTTNDQATFDHTGVTTGTVINDMWVFDIAPSGNGSASANFTVAAPFTGFSGALYFAGATTACAGAAGTACTVVALGAAVPGGGDNSADPAVVSTNLIGLAAGRYIFNLTGTAGSPFGTYTGQVATNNVVVPEPALLSLVGLSLVALARRRRKA